VGCSRTIGSSTPSSDGALEPLAHHLRGLGVRPAMCGGLCDRAPLRLAMLGGCSHLKARRAYCRWSIRNYPPERLAFMLADAGAPVLLTRRHCARICAAQ